MRRIGSEALRNKGLAMSPREGQGTRMKPILPPVQARIEDAAGRRKNFPRRRAGGGAKAELARRIAPVFRRLRMFADLLTYLGGGTSAPVPLPPFRNWKDLEGG